MSLLAASLVLVILTSSVIIVIIILGRVVLCFYSVFFRLVAVGHLVAAVKVMIDLWVC